MSKHKVHDMHHLLPRSQGGKNTKENMVRVPQALHRAWHLLFRNMLPPEVAREINRSWISKDWKIVAFVNKRNNTASKIIYEDADCKITLKEKTK